MVVPDPLNDCLPAQYSAQTILLELFSVFEKKLNQFCNDDPLVGDKISTSNNNVLRTRYSPNLCVEERIVIWITCWKPCKTSVKYACPLSSSLLTSGTSRNNKSLLMRTGLWKKCRLGGYLLGFQRGPRESDETNAGCQLPLLYRSDWGPATSSVLSNRMRAINQPSAC